MDFGLGKDVFYIIIDYLNIVDYSNLSKTNYFFNQLLKNHKEYYKYLQMKSGIEIFVLHVLTKITPLNRSS